MDARAQKTSDSNTAACARSEFENRLAQAALDSIDFKVFVHDQENVEISRGRLRGDKADPNENPTQFSAYSGEIQERPKAA